MALKSVVDIVVNDAEFQRFQALFNNYQAGLAATPAAWSAANTAATATAGAVAAGAQGLQHHVVLINQAAAASKTAAAHTASQAGAWHSMARDARTFAGHVFEATRSLLRWGELTGVISGILGGGGLFGIDRLAINAGGRRKSALGLGVSPGEESAFKLNYGRLLDSPDQMLGGVNEAMHDLSKRGALYGAGLQERDLAGKNSAQVSADLVPLLKKLADQTPDSQMAQVIQSRHLDQFMTLQDFQRLKNTPAGEVAGYKTSYERDSRTLDLTREQALAWQNLQVQLKRAGESIENVFITALTPLAPAIGRLSDAFTKVVSDLLHNPHIAEWIDGLAKSIKEFGDWIGTPKFQKDVNEFIDSVGELVDHAGAFTKSILGIGAGLSEFESGVQETAKFLDILWHTMDEAGKGIAKVAHFILDPITSLFGRGPEENQSPTDPGTHREIPFFPHWNRNTPFTDPSGEFGPPTGQPSAFHPTGSPNDPRGIRNNNPLNISYVPGQVGLVGSDGRFGIYGSQEAGIASAERQLLRYQERGIDTLTKVISKWAPPSENDTGAYVARVSRETGIDPNARIDFRNQQQAAAIIASMARHETGRQLDPAVVNRGVGTGLGAAGNGMKQTQTNIRIDNNTGGNATVSVSQLAM